MTWQLEIHPAAPGMVFQDDWYDVYDGDTYRATAADKNTGEMICKAMNVFDELVARLEAMCDLAELQGGFDDEDGLRSIARSREVLEKARKEDG